MTDDQDRFESIDALFERMKEDDLRDELEGVTKMTPGNYAKLRKRTPQSVYHHLRSGKLTWERCDCGRRIIDVQEADELFGYQQQGQDDVSGRQDHPRHLEDIPDDL